MAFEAEDEGTTGDIGILVVNNMLITGFNAPVEQVMYLDRVITNHNLLQAIARVNRVAGDTKDKGFVVDYVGIGHHLRTAIQNYDQREQTEIIDALSFPEQELHNLQQSHAEIMALLEHHGLADLTDHDAFFDAFYDEDLRFDYMQAFRKFTRCLNLLFPARQALEFVGAYNALSEINVLAGKHFRDERLSMRGIPPKLRSITDAYLESKGIDQKVEPISIMDADFQKDVGKHRRRKTKAASVEHAIRHHLEIELNDDPDLQASFAEALAQIFRDFQDNWTKIYEKLEKLRQHIIKARQEPTYGLHRKKQMPFFRNFKRELFGEDEPDEDQISLLVDLTEQVYQAVKLELGLTGFWESLPARNRLKAEIQKVLVQSSFAKLPNLLGKRAQVNSRVMEIAEKNNDIILYAE